MMSACVIEWSRCIQRFVESSDFIDRSAFADSNVLCYRRYAIQSLVDIMNETNAIIEIVLCNSESTANLQTFLDQAISFCRSSNALSVILLYHRLICWFHIHIIDCSNGLQPLSFDPNETIRLSSVSWFACHWAKSRLHRWRRHRRWSAKILWLCDDLSADSNFFRYDNVSWLISHSW